LRTQTGNPALIELIRAEIQKRGPVSFAWFMEQALYHPEHGYYSSGRCAIGRHGDYFTNVSVGPLFGRLLTAQFAQMWERLGQPRDFIIVEQGAHHGDFARDVLDSARRSYPDFFVALRYRIVEPFSTLQDRQSQTLQSFRDKVEWRDSIEPFVGLHFSNELLDSMPVNLRGKLVGLDGDDFVFVQGAAVSNPPREEGPCNQVALDWLDNVSRDLLRGYVLMIDYGYSRDEFRQNVQVRAQHRYLDSPFERIGHADITAHVNWTTIVEHAQKNGLRLAGFTDQYHFLTGIIFEWPDLTEDPKIMRALQTLLHPEMLGRAFQVLALEKGDPAADPHSASLRAGSASTEDVDLGGRLAGFKFARNAVP